MGSYLGVRTSPSYETTMNKPLSTPNRTPCVTVRREVSHVMDALRM